MKSIIVDGVEFIEKQAPGTLCIVVLDRGFVVVGNVEFRDQYVVITNCSCVRRWGTQRGLGQLATEGPTDNTILDPQPTTQVHELQVVQIIWCDGAAWKR